MVYCRCRCQTLLILVEKKRVFVGHFFCWEGSATYDDLCNIDYFFLFFLSFLLSYLHRKWLIVLEFCPVD